ncbi:MAG TPA: preprotein translocase subunit SecE [Candidatus Paceibacterota bacterium]|nr:preprotein translocase subunit SecE [Candidatus Paceibacterota bacterium]
MRVEALGLFLRGRNKITMVQKIKAYFIESYNELRRVNWPTRSETINLTLIVVGFSLVVSIFLGLLDMFFSYLLSQIIL